MKDENPLVWLVNGTPEEEEFVKKALGEKFSISPVHSMSPAVQRQLKRLIKQDGLYGAVCCLDADGPGPTAKHKAWFSAKYLMRMDIPVVCYSLEEYDEKQWKMLKRRFSELNTDIYFVLSYKEDQANFILSALNKQTAEKEKRLHKEKQPWAIFKRTVKDRLAL